MNKPINFLIRVLTALIPSRGLRRRVRRRWLDSARDAMLKRLVPVIRARYAEHVVRCREKLARGERLRVCFLVCDIAQFSAEPVYQRMRGDSRFEPFIAVVPRVTRGEAFLRDTQQKTIDVLTARYGEVERLYDPDTRRREPFGDRADIVYTSIIYTEQTFFDYTAEVLSEHALVACITYGYSGLLNANANHAIAQPEIAMMWHYFVSNTPTMELWTKTNPYLRYSARLSGYAKMDRLATVPVHPERPKTVIIAPHHSLAQNGDGLELSTFLIHSELFLQLPKEYPEIKFVFRPHPLLFPRLATSKWWGEAKTAAYRAAMEAQPNVEFQQGGDYFETFANADALIHDCGSFLAEFFYTGKPQCYLFANHETEVREFLPFGQKLLDLSHKAYDASGIRRFIDEVVVGGQDGRAAERNEFARENICCFYPHASDRVIDATVESIEKDEQT